MSAFVFLLGALVIPSVSPEYGGRWVQERSMPSKIQLCQSSVDVSSIKGTVLMEQLGTANQVLSADSPMDPQLFVSICLVMREFILLLAELQNLRRGSYFLSTLFILKKKRLVNHIISLSDFITFTFILAN